MMTRLSSAYFHRNGLTQTILLSAVLAMSAAWPAAAQDDAASPVDGREPALSAAAPDDPTLREADIVFGGPEAVTVETAGGDVVFRAEIAATSAQQRRGLMWRESLAPDAAMLFQYQPPRIASIWMENTLIPLDILYVGADGRIVKIAANAQPGSRRSLSSDFPIAAVLEIAGGRATELGIRPGDTLRHAYFNNLDSDAPAPEAGLEADASEGGGDDGEGDDAG